MHVKFPIAIAAALFIGCTQSSTPMVAPATPSVTTTSPDTTSTPLIADQTESEPAPEQPLGREVDTGELRLTAPEVWRRNPPRSQFVLAEFALPKAEGDERDGRLTISLAGGTPEANIDRWRGQFVGSRDVDTQGEIEAAGKKIVIVDLVGTYNDQAGPFAPGETRDGYRMLGAIIPGDGQQLTFIKAYGPKRTMAEHEQAFFDFVKSVSVQ
jgi:hypothetical protein